MPAGTGTYNGCRLWLRAALELLPVGLPATRHPHARSQSTGSSKPARPRSACRAAVAAAADPSARGVHTEEVCRQLAGARQRGEVSAGEDVDVAAQPLAGHPPLELDREETVIRTGDDPGRDVGPLGSVAPRFEHEV